MKWHPSYPRWSRFAAQASTSSVKHTHTCTFSRAVTKIDGPGAHPADHSRAGHKHFQGIETLRWAMCVFLILDGVFTPGCAPHHHHWTLWLAHLEPETIKSVHVPTYPATASSADSLLRCSKLAAHAAQGKLNPMQNVFSLWMARCHGWLWNNASTSCQRRCDERGEEGREKDVQRERKGENGERNIWCVRHLRESKQLN